MVAHVAQAQRIYLGIFFLRGGGGGRGRVRSGTGFGREAWTTGSSSPIPPHQVELRKPSDRAIMSGRLKCMLKRDTGKTI